MHQDTMGRLLVWIAATVLGGLVMPASAQNLVQNASFGAGDDHWTVVMPSLSMVDSGTGSDAPPSMRVATDASPTALAQVYSACIAIADDSLSYDLIVDILHDSGTTEATVTAYSGGCLSPMSVIASVTGSGSGWQEQSALNFNLPAGTGGVRITLQADGPLAAANFDRVRFGPTGTTPVQLQWFGID